MYIIGIRHNWKIRRLSIIDKVNKSITSLKIILYISFQHYILMFCILWVVLITIFTGAAEVRKYKGPLHQQTAVYPLHLVPCAHSRMATCNSSHPLLQAHQRALRHAHSVLQPQHLLKFHPSAPQPHSQHLHFHHHNICIWVQNLCAVMITCRNAIMLRYTKKFVSYVPRRISPHNQYPLFQTAFPQHNQHQKCQHTQHQVRRCIALLSCISPSATRQHHNDLTTMMP